MKEIEQLNQQINENNFTTLPIDEQYDLLDKYSKLLVKIDPEASVRYCKKLIQIAEKTENPLNVAYSHQRLSHSYFLLSQPNKALEHYLKALKIYEEQNLMEEQAKMLGNIASIYLSLENLNKSLYFNKRALKIFEILGDNEGIARTDLNIGSCLFKKDDIDNALIYYKKSLEYSRKAGEAFIAPYAYHNIGNVNIFYHQYEEALTNLVKALEYWEKGVYQYGIAASYNKIGLTYGLIGKEAEAEQYLKKALDIAVLYKLKDVELDIYEDYYKLYLHQNKFEKSLENYRNFAELKYKMLEEKRTEQIEKLIYLNELESKDKEILESEARFQILAETEMVGVYILKNGKMSYVNPALANIFGYEPKELIGCDPLVFIHPMDHTLVSENIRRRIDGEVEKLQYEFHGLCKNGDIRNIEARGSRIEINGEVSIIGNILDITERKKIEMEMQLTEKRLRGIIESTSDFIWTVDPVHFGIQTYNSALFHYFLEKRGITLHVGDTPDILVKPKEEDWKYFYTKALELGSYETEYKVVAGSNILFLKFNKLMLNDEVFGISVFGHDVTERKRKEEEIKQLNESLEQKVQQRTKDLELSNQALESFTHSVSHDLKAPLRAINGFAKIVTTEFDEKLDKNISRYLKVISDNAIRMDQLITGMLSLSKVDQKQLNKEMIDMENVVNCCIKECIQDQDRVRITWIIEDLQKSMGDPILIKQVWTNLIENAVKYSRNKENPTIKIKSEVKDNQCTYSIQDNGAGFNPNFEDKLFKMFGRLHRVDEFEGTGIGLSIVDRIVRRHGGKVWAEGEEGVGATFYFSLPKEKNN